MRINSSGNLEIGDCDTVELAHTFGTPLYVLDEKEIRGRCRIYVESLRNAYPNSQVLYAGKAFLTKAMCRIVEQEGLGLDVVSGGELYTALSAGFPAERIYFHGNNKSPDEIAMGVEAGVHRFIVDSLHEMALLEEMSASSDSRSNVILRIAPGVEAHTHTYMRTGQVDSKFGFGIGDGRAVEAVELALKSPHLRLCGLHSHIGSQIFAAESFALAASIMVDFMDHLRQRFGLTVEELDLGGGIGIRYSAEDTPLPISAFVRTITDVLIAECRKREVPLPRLLIEPGRSIVGEAGTTLYTVGAIKDIPNVRKYVFVDGGMADNPRVALYQSKYEALIANKAADPPREKVTIAGKCCESGDILIWDIELPVAESGDILAVFSTGAYNYSMASNYNRLTRPAVVLVRDGEADLIVRREAYCDLVRNDCLPERLVKAEGQSPVSVESYNELPGKSTCV